ncbi:hypothetical protein [Aequorivita sp. KMM 9714]|uniref:hypothetical protein n=1 Tax=Aequorivita sp. KMM 9714 TaxID=2707173 RepID=UPI0013EB97AE|nr:hypothetical protein [Aequorivita sp. KMM 9714]NGX82726.1 hypothetical protein [Aequorivita sp. KMM 9714]
MKKNILVLFLLCFSTSIFCQSIESKREKMVDLINTGFKKIDVGKSYKRFARSEGNELYVFIQDRLALDRNTFNPLHKKFVDRYCYSAGYFLFEDEFVKQFYIQELRYVKIIFNLELTLEDFSQLKYSREISQTDLIDLNIPFTEGEFREILQ